MRHLLGIRSHQPEFDPYGPQKVLRVDQRIFGLERYALEGDSRILVLVNVSAETFDLNVNGEIFGQADDIRDLISGETFRIADGKVQIHFTPYQYLWLKA